VRIEQGCSSIRVALRRMGEKGGGEIKVGRKEKTEVSSKTEPCAARVGRKKEKIGSLMRAFCG